MKTEPEIAFQLDLAMSFLEAIKNRTGEQFWDTLSAESRGYWLGYFNGRGQININKVVDPSREEIGNCLSGVLESINDILENMYGQGVLDHLGFSHRILKKDDDLHIAVKALPGHETEVIYIAPTQVIVILVPLILEITAKTDEGHRADWKVDYIEFMRGFTKNTYEKFISSYK